MCVPQVFRSADGLFVFPFRRKAMRRWIKKNRQCEEDGVMQKIDAHSVKMKRQAALARV